MEASTACWRLFWAIPVSITPELTQVFTDLERWRSAVKPVRPEQIHFTMKFLGDTAPELTNAVIDAGQRAILAAIPNLTCCGVGVFPPRGRPTVLWAGLKSADALVELAKRLDLAMTALGFAPERRQFQPHLTLARFKAAPPRPMQRWLDEHRDSEFGTLALNELVLFRSELTPSGSIYTALFRAPLW